MKIYISLPITGHNIEEVEASCILASGVIQRLGHTPVSPLDVSPNPEATYAQHMGNDIAALLECDGVLFLPDWRTSKGCRLEREAANIYDKATFYDFNQIPPHNCPYHVRDFAGCIEKNQTVIYDEAKKIRTFHINCCCKFYVNRILCEATNIKNDE